MYPRQSGGANFYRENEGVEDPFPTDVRVAQAGTTIPRLTDLIQVRNGVVGENLAAVRVAG